MHRLMIAFGALVGLAIIVVAIAVALSQKPGNVTIEKPNSKLTVAASISPLSNFVEAIGGNLVEVSTIVPPGKNPKDYQPASSQTSVAFNAKLFVRNGLGLETWADQVVKRSGNADLLICDASGDLRLAPASGFQPVKQGTLVDGTLWHLTPDGKGIVVGGVEFNIETLDSQASWCRGDICLDWQDIKAQLNGNVRVERPTSPYVWLDPVMAKQQVRTITAALIQADPFNEAAYKANSEKYLAQLDALTDSIRNTVSPLKGKEFVSVNSVWTHFGARYGLKEVGSLAVDSTANLSALKLRDILDTLMTLNARTLLVGPDFDSSVASVITAQTNCKVIVLDPIGGPGISGRGNYTDMMLYDVDQLTKAFGS